MPGSVGHFGTSLALLEILDVHLEGRLNLLGARLTGRPALVVVHKCEPRKVGAVIATHLEEKHLGLGDNPDSLATLVVHNREDAGTHLAVDAADVAALVADNVAAEDRLDAEEELGEPLLVLALNRARVELHREVRGGVKLSPRGVHRIHRERGDVEVRLHTRFGGGLDKLDGGARLALNGVKLVALGADDKPDVALEKVVAGVEHKCVGRHYVA